MNALKNALDEKINVQIPDWKIVEISGQPRLQRIAGNRHQKPVPHQKFLQQPPDAFIIIDDQQMRLWLGHTPPSFRV